MDTAENIYVEPTFQSQGRAWHPGRPDILDLLSSAEQVDIRPIYYGSNECFLVTLQAGKAGRSLAVYKPAEGEYPLYDFPYGTLYRREVAAAVVDRTLGWSLVPPTVEIDGDFGPGSLQLFIENHGRGEIEVSELRRLALLDIILNNADRKPEHVLVGDGGKLWGIDHGLTFHVQPKLRTVLWHFAGTSLEPGEVSDLEKLLQMVEGQKRKRRALERLISHVEIIGLRTRVSRLLGARVFPNPRYKAVPHRW